MKDPKLCTIDGCERVRTSTLYCQTHYRSFRLYGDPLKLKKNPVGSVCKHPGCLLKPRVKGLCDKHYSRLQRHGSTYVTKSDPRDISLKERIMGNVLIDDNGCWLWQKRLNHDGYGIMSILSRHKPVHRIVYQEWIGDIPEGMEICHRCDVRNCCNPKHLFAATHLENMQDMVNKGRGASVSGENNPRAILTEKQVRLIFKRLIEGEHVGDIAEYFGVPNRIVHNIKNLKAWKSVFETLPVYDKVQLRMRKQGRNLRFIEKI